MAKEESGIGAAPLSPFVYCCVRSCQVRTAPAGDIVHASDGAGSIEDATIIKSASAVPRDWLVGKYKSISSGVFRNPPNWRPLTDSELREHRDRAVSVLEDWRDR